MGGSSNLLVQSLFVKELGVGWKEVSKAGRGDLVGWSAFCKLIGQMWKLGMSHLRSMESRKPGRKSFRMLFLVAAGLASADLWLP